MTASNVGGGDDNRGADRQLKNSTEGLEGLDLRRGDPAPKVWRRETGMEERKRWGGRDRWGGRHR